MTRNKRLFLLDANVFIQAKRQYYAFDLCPGFWNCVSAWHSKGAVYSIDRVKDELERGQNDLTQWATKEISSAAFISTEDQPIIASYSQIMSWVEAQSQFTTEAKAEFAANADGWLVACAMAKGMVLVTHEVYEPGAKKRVKMPNVCRKFAVSYTDTFDMLRELSAQFHWKPNTT